ncbi:MAG: V-type ATP synthase subunit I [Candidatus Brocadiia bacterium]
MAIDRMKHATLLAPKRLTGQLLDSLQEQGVIHVEETAEELPESEGFAKPAKSTDEADQHVNKLEEILRIFDDFEVKESSLAKMVVHLPTRVDQAERGRVLENFDYRPLYEECTEAAREHQKHQDAIGRLEEEIENLEFFQDLPFSPEDVRSLKTVKCWVGTMPATHFQHFENDEEMAEVVSVQKVRARKRGIDMVAVALPEDADEAGRILRREQFAERTLPEIDESIASRLEKLQVQKKEHDEGARECSKRIEEASEHQREVEIMLGYWEAQSARIRAENNALRSNRIAVISGYVRAKDQHRLYDLLDADFPQVSALYRDPTPEDDVPVSLTHGPLTKPVRVLVDMFGVPDYFGFDPTPFLVISFLVFFGMCFADAVYGLALALICWYLSRKAKGYEGLRNLILLFAYCGVSTMVFGVLSGSWAADLPIRIAGDKSAVATAVNTMAVVSPMDSAVDLLLLTFAIGVVNQLYAMVLKGYGQIRRGHPLDAFLDAGLWIIMIPSFLIIIAPIFVEMPERVHRIGTRVGLVTAILLVLTQGRKEESIIGKAAIGLVSLYGVMGSYGCVSFISDMLSYSRLLALGLATTVIGMSLNIVAEMLNIGGVIGIILFALVVVFGHSVNFALGMIGAFVHPVRLIFVEFFSRFYKSASDPFRPLSWSTDHVIVEG